MAQEQILVIDDSPEISALIDKKLGPEGYSIVSAESGEAGLESIRANKPDIVILDLGLPGIDGFDVCREIREDAEIKDLPVIMLSAKDGESDVVAGLELGADDYVTKPFSPKILLARIRSSLRKRRQGALSEDSPVEYREISLHPAKFEVRVAGEVVEFTPTEFKTLSFLLRRPGWVFTRDQITEGIHGPGYVVVPRAVDMQIVALRRKLGPYGDYIETVRGIGYRMAALDD
jgi:two-component system phosphate regulon response regulator PhoB